MISRDTLALVLPPIVALAGAALYTQWRAELAEGAIAKFCASVNPGMTAREVAHAALAAEFEVRDGGPDSSTMAISKSAFKLREEIYSCNVKHNGVLVVAKAFEHAQR